jgi:hypothetical protein
VFSHTRGFYTNPFDLIITTEISSLQIIYTVDSSDPRKSPTAIIKQSPTTINISTLSEETGRAKTPGFILKVCGKLDNGKYTIPTTHTYLFANEIINLSKENIKPGSQWPNPTKSSTPQSIDYGLANDILTDARYKDLINDAFLSIPTLSLTTDIKNLFSTSTGIYMNAYQDGVNWEREGSLELLNPDDSEGFQINCGIRIRGGASRSGSNPKHAFRLFFRNEYGAAKLKFPLFGDEGVDEFDKIDLRTSQNYSWSFPGHQGEYNTMNRDVFSRDLQREVNQPYTRSRYYHLYINGVYWGIFQTQERSEARFAASYFGGNVEDYDVIKAGDNWPAQIEATDGNLDAFKEVWNYCVSGFKNDSNYFKLQGLNEDGTANPLFKKLVDIDNLIDFMLVIFFTGNFDTPISKFGNNNTPRNFYCIINRNGNEGFKFFVHDAEHSLRTTSGEGPGIGLYENRVNIGSITNNYKMVVNSFDYFHPQWLHFKLSDNPEYKIRFADRVFKHMFRNGIMTTDRAKLLFLSRVNEIENAIIAESARWGNTYHSPSRNKDDDWLKAVNDIANNYFPYRTQIVINQLKGEGLFPNINPPRILKDQTEISTQRFVIDSPMQIKIDKSNNQNGIIYYTTDGKDPRQISGSLASTAISKENAIELSVTNSTLIKTRILNGTTWSALNEVYISYKSDEQNIKFTEIHYHPLDGDGISDNEYEFIEIKNIGNLIIDLSLCEFTSGIGYSFPAETMIRPNEFVVLASNIGEFFKRYNFYPFGEYSGQLDNGGEKITLSDNSGNIICSVTYNDKSPWPVEADGSGFSLVTTESNPTNDLNDPKNWRASYHIHGSPGKDDILTKIELKRNILPVKFELTQNFPNPFNPETTINFSIPFTETPSIVTLRVYDILGREIATLVNEERYPGNYVEKFNINDIERLSSLTSGIYFYRLLAGSFSDVKKMIYLK